MADKPAVLDDHGVDGAQAFGVGGDLIEVLKHQLLARVRDVQPVEAHPVGALQQVADGVAGKAQLQEIDGAVQVAEALHVAFAFMHVGSE